MKTCKTNFHVIIDKRQWIQNIPLTNKHIIAMALMLYIFEKTFKDHLAALTERHNELALRLHQYHHQSK